MIESFPCYTTTQNEYRYTMWVYHKYKLLMMMIMSEVGWTLKEMWIFWIADHENIKSTSFVLFIVTGNLGYSIGFRVLCVITYVWENKKKYRWKRYSVFMCIPPLIWYIIQRCGCTFCTKITLNFLHTKFAVERCYDYICKDWTPVLLEVTK